MFLVKACSLHDFTYKVSSFIIELVLAVRVNSSQESWLHDLRLNYVGVSNNCYLSSIGQNVPVFKGLKIAVLYKQLKNTFKHSWVYQHFHNVMLSLGSKQYSK